MTAGHDHDHDHDHDDHGDGHGHDHDTHGPEFFDRVAETWDDDPAKVERAAAVARQLAGRLELGPGTRLLEYGAGTGLVTQALLSALGPAAADQVAVTVADPSAGMRDALAAKAAAGTLPADARIWSLDLTADPVPGERFDLVVTVQVLHHVHDLDRALAGFAALVEPGGHLAIVDLEAEDGSFHGEGFGGHHGFARDDLAARLRTAGFAEVEFEDAYRMEKEGRSYPLFLALATR
jgi:ubiquinone/menaquinone biosynthesis C-methylase UbiE